MLHDPAGSAGLQTHGDFRNAVPTRTTSSPCLYIAGLPPRPAARTDVLVGTLLLRIAVDDGLHP